MIRRAQQKDIGRINLLLSQVNMVHHLGRPDLFNVGNKYTDEQLVELIKDDSRPIFVFTDENDVVLGYCFCIHQQHVNDNILTDVKTLYIDDLCVEENVRGQHVGKQLYQYVKQYAKDAGCYNLTLNVWQLNPSAYKFYVAMGLEIQKTVMETIL